jgi:hypothetical protein
MRNSNGQRLPTPNSQLPIPIPNSQQPNNSQLPTSNQRANSQATGRFFSALLLSAAVERLLLPASGNRSNYLYDFFVDTPRSSRYIAHLRYATIFVLADPYLGGPIHRSSPSHCPQSLSIYRPPIIFSLRPTHLRAYVAYKQQRELQAITGC